MKFTWLRFLPFVLVALVVLASVKELSAATAISTAAATTTNTGNTKRFLRANTQKRGLISMFNPCEYVDCPEHHTCIPSTVDEQYESTTECRDCSQANCRDDQVCEKISNSESLGSDREFDCRCPHNTFEDADGLACVSVYKLYQQELLQQQDDGSRPQIKIEFMSNGGADTGTTLTLFNDTAEVWNGSCMGAYCEINENISIDDLVCEELHLLVEIYGGGGSGSAALTSPAFVSVTFDDTSVLFLGTPTGTFDRMMRYVHPAEYDFTSCPSIRTFVNIQDDSLGGAPDPSTDAGKAAIGSVNPESGETEPKIGIDFVNSNNTLETNLTIFNGSAQVWNGSCSGALCTISDNINATGLKCEDLHLFVDIEGGESFVDGGAAWVNITFNNVSVVFKGNVPLAQDPAIRDLLPGVHNFTNCPVDPLSAAGKVAIGSSNSTPTFPEDEPEIAIQFMNSNSGLETNLTLLMDGTTPLWNGTCTGAFCTITDTVSAANVTCEDLHLLIDIHGDELLVGDAYVNVTFNNVSVVFDGAPQSGPGALLKMMRYVKPGVHNFTDCPAVPLVAAAAAAGKGAVEPTEENPGTTTEDPNDEKHQIRIAFVNDASGAEATLTLLHGATVLWSDSCTGDSCSVFGTVIESGIVCNDLSLKVARSNDAVFDSTAMIKVMLDDAPALYEIDAFAPGIFDFECDNAVAGYG